METLPVAHQNVFVSLRAFDTGGGATAFQRYRGNLEEILMKKTTHRLYEWAKTVSLRCKTSRTMTFDDITEDGRLWAVRYDGETDNALYALFDQWNDVMWLRAFFKKNWQDLTTYFKITDINQAIEDTIEDSERLQGIIMDISPDVNLDEIFQPLENFRTSDMLLGKEKARLRRVKRHTSWLRIYAIKLSEGVYLITGGAIKLTLRMEEREHTRRELVKMEKVRAFLLHEHIIDDDSFVEYMNTL